VADSELPLEVKNVATDRWGRHYEIECIVDQVVVRSVGPDGVLGTTDDISVK
jgi:hypothetical protein